MARRALLLAVVLVAGLAAFAVTPPRAARSMRQFEPTRIADLELEMWRAYYAKERVHLFALLVTTLHEQYHYSWADAARQAFHLARTAATFSDSDRRPAPRVVSRAAHRAQRTLRPPRVARPKSSRSAV
jgi:hypothetical protein